MVGGVNLIVYCDIYQYTSKHLIRTLGQNHDILDRIMKIEAL